MKHALPPSGLLYLAILIQLHSLNVAPPKSLHRLKYLFYQNSLIYLYRLKAYL